MAIVKTAFQDAFGTLFLQNFLQKIFFFTTLVGDASHPYGQHVCYNDR